MFSRVVDDVMFGARACLSPRAAFTTELFLHALPIAPLLRDASAVDVSDPMTGSDSKHEAK
jgi:hypothetical protein